MIFANESCVCGCPLCATRAGCECGKEDYNTGATPTPRVIFFVCTAPWRATQ